MQGLDVLREQMARCASCDLHCDRHNVVFGEGSTTPLLMIVGEAPGEEEDKQGVPFVGKVGEKLDKMLTYAGVTRDEIYITNSVLCRPPNGRNPRGEELAACKWRLDLQVQLLRPKLVVVLGKIALQQVLGHPIKGALSQYFPEHVEDGSLNYSVDGHKSQIVVTYHPSYHLRSPEKAYRISLPHWTLIKRWVINERTKSSI